MANLFESERPAPEGAIWLHGESEIAMLLRSRDWSHTPLGPLESWPPALVATLNLVLGSKFPMSIYWGSQFLLFYNDAYRAFLGTKHPASLGMPGPEVWSRSWHAFADALAQVHREGETVHGENVLIPIDVDGEIQDRYWTYSRSPIFEDGHIGGIFTVAQDVTDIVVSRQELVRSEERLRMALAASHGVGLYDWDVAKNLVYAEPNFARAFNVDPEAAAVGVPIERFTASIHPDDYERVSRAIAHELATGKGYAEEYRLLQPDGSIRWLTVQGRCSMAPDGSPVRFSGVAVDITDRRMTEAALLQNEKLAAVGRLASSIAHEINNPLESVTNLIYLARTAPELATAREFLDLAERELSRASAITNQTLRFHKQSTKPQQVTAKELFDSATTLYHGKLTNARIQLETDFRATHGVLCFEGEIRQVLANLIANAVDAMPGDGTGRLQLRSHDTESHGHAGLLLTVADNGGGIPESARARLFEPFFTTKGVNGNGLGLWISHEIVTRHGGSIRLHTSQLPARHGTVFTIFLPLVCSTSEAQPA